MPRFISLTTEDFPTMLLQMEVHLAMRQARPESFITKSGELHVEYLGDEDGDEYALIRMPVDHKRIFAEVSAGDSDVFFGHLNGFRIYTGRVLSDAD
jgi:hypothetical protein